MTSLNTQELRRIARQLALPGFGLEQQEKLSNAHILVIGGGGLGCPAMQSLASAGVGHITVIDDDTVDLSNIHRQILFAASDVGRRKVEVVAERLQDLQPSINVTALCTRLTAKNATELFSGVDLVLDGSDTFATKYLAADAAEITSTPLVWGTVLRFRGDVALWADGVGLRDLFPQQPDADSIPDCATAGVLGVTTSVVGGLMATEAIKYLAGIGESVPGRLLTYDALTSSLRSFHVAPDLARKKVSSLEGHDAPVCPLPEPAELELVRSGAAIALDVRELHEKLIEDIDAPGLHLPMSEASEQRVADALAGIDIPVVVYCTSGIRSSKFIAAFASTTRVELRNLPGGMGAISQTQRV